MTIPFEKLRVRNVVPTVKLLTDRDAESMLNEWAIAINTGKSLDQSVGQFGLEVVPKSIDGTAVSTTKLEAYLWKTIRPMDIVTIGYNSKMSFMGLVDTCTFDKNSKGNGKRSIKVQGRCMGKLLMVDQVYKSTLNLATNPQYRDFVNARPALKAFFGGTNFGADAHLKLGNRPPAELIDQLLRTFPSICNKIRVGQTINQETELAMGDFWDTELRNWPGDMVVTAQALNTFQGPVWNMLLQCLDAAFYELFIDYRLGLVTPESAEQTYENVPRAVLRLRPKPFDRLFDEIMVRVGDTKVDAAGLTAQEARDFIYPGISAEEAAEMLEADETYDPLGRTTHEQQIREIQPGQLEVSPTTFQVESSDYKWKAMRINDIKDKDGNYPLRQFTWDNLRCFVRPDLPYHTLTEAEIASKTVAVSDAEVFTIIGVVPNSTLIGKSPPVAGIMHRPFLDTLAIDKYGVRPQSVNKSLGNSDPSGKFRLACDSLDVCEAYSNRVRNWSLPNILFESGTLVVLGNDEIRIGDPIYIKDEFSLSGRLGLKAYVKGVTNSFSRTGKDSSYQTTINFTRAANDEDLVELFKGKTPDDLRNEFKERIGISLANIGIIRGRGLPQE